MKFVCLFLGLAAASRASTGPLAKVVELLKKLKADTEGDAKTEASQYAEYYEWSRVTVDETEDSIQDGERNEEMHSANKANGEAEAAGANSEVTRLAGEIAAGEQDLQEAKDLKAKQAKDCAAGEKELQDTLDQLIRATAILKRNFDSTALIQGSKIMSIVSGLKTVIAATSLEGSSRSQLSSLLEEADDDDMSPAGAPEGKAYQSKVGAVIDACENLRVEAEDKLRELRRDCAEKAHNSEMTMQKLSDTLEVDNKDLNMNKQNAASATEAAGTATGKLADTQKGLKEDRTYLAEVKSTTDLKHNEQDQRAATRADELKAINKAIEILTAQFSFIQTDSKLGLNKQVRGDVAAVLAKVSSVALQQLANRIEAANDPFVKVRGMIKDMVSKLEKQAAEEATHNAWCNKETKETKAKRDALQAEVDKFSARAAKLEAAIDTLKQEIATLSGETADLEKQVAEATSLRQNEAEQTAKEHAQFLEDIDAVNRATEVLREQFSFVQQPATAVGGDIGGDNSAGASGILGILEVAASDMSKADAEAQATNSENQRVHDELKQKSKTSIAQKNASRKAKESEVSSTESSLQEAKQDADGSTEELEATLTTLDKLRKQCEHKPQTFAERAAKRQSEIEGLKEALRVLNEETAGAGEFLQKRIAVHEA